MTVGRGRSKSVRDSLAELEKLDLALAQYDGVGASPSEMNSVAISKGVDPHNKTASIRSRHTTHKISAVEIEDIMLRQGSQEDDRTPVRRPSLDSGRERYHNTSRVDISQPVPARNFTSATQAEVYRSSNSSGSEIHTLTYASSPDQQQSQRNIPPHPKSSTPVPPPSRQSSIPPPPLGTPPQPPKRRDSMDGGSSEVVQITKMATYANVSEEIQAEKAKESPYESSFRPGRNARLSQVPIGETNKVLSHSLSSSSTTSSSSPQTQSEYSTNSAPSAYADEPIYQEPDPDYDVVYHSDNRQAETQQDTNQSPFADAIKMAAIAREKRRDEESSGRAKAAHPPPSQNDKRVPAPPNWSPGTKPSPIAPRKMPERLRKQDEDPNNELMAAVARRRNIVEKNGGLPNNQTPVNKQPEKRPETTAPASPENTNFLAEAERLRQDYLKKKTGTLDRRKTESPSPPKSAAPPPPPPKSVTPAPPPPKAAPPAPPPGNGPPPPPPLPPNGLPPPPVHKPKPSSLDEDSPKSTLRKTPTQQCASRPADKTGGDGAGSPGLGGLAAIIAQRAKERNNTSVDNNGNLSSKTVSHSKTYRSQTSVSNGSVTNGVTKMAEDVKTPPSKVNIQGATTDSSNTESNNLVMNKMKMFESTNGGVTNGKKSSKHYNGRDMAPPMIIPPPPSYHQNGHHNDHDTAGWVINSSPKNGSNNYHHEAAIRHKLAQNMHDVGGQREIEDGGVVVMVDDFFVPPPPLFDGVVDPAIATRVRSHEDNASLVSSLSTLSTLSSNEHDHHDSSGYSSSKQGVSPDIFPEIAPPPPGFDDSPENGGTFLPPPMEFETAPPVQRNTLTSFRNKPMKQWSTQDVADWLDSMQMSELKVSFICNNINGQILARMGRTELINIGVKQVGHRMSIERAIKRAQLDE